MNWQQLGNTLQLQHLNEKMCCFLVTLLVLKGYELLLLPLHECLH